MTKTPNTNKVESLVTSPARVGTEFSSEGSTNAVSVRILPAAMPDFDAMKLDSNLKMKMVLRHKKQFPSIIQSQINIAYVETRMLLLERKKKSVFASDSPSNKKRIASDAKKIDDTVSPSDFFLKRVYNKVRHFSYINKYYRQYDGSSGLNNERDTPSEVETMIRFFPRILTDEYSPRDNRYLISYLIAHESSNTFNFNTVTFLPLVLKLNIELCGVFHNEVATAQGPDHSRYGLLGRKIARGYGFGPGNIFRQLSNRWVVASEQQQILIDRVSLAMLKELRNSFGLFFKEDIVKFNLVGSLIHQQHETKRSRKVLFTPSGWRRRSRGLLDRMSVSYVPDEERLRYLIGWDPNSLLSVQKFGKNTPLHYYFHGGSHNRPMDNRTEVEHIRGFRLLLELYLMYHPKRFGLLFHNNAIDKTPYTLACKAYSSIDNNKDATIENGAYRNKVDGIIDSVVVLVQEKQRCYIRSTNTSTSSTTTTNSGVMLPNKNAAHTTHEHCEDAHEGNGPIDTLEALIFAASEDTIDIDGVYFLLRREPSLLSSSRASSASDGSSGVNTTPNA